MRQLLASVSVVLLGTSLGVGVLLLMASHQRLGQAAVPASIGWIYLVPVEAAAVYGGLAAFAGSWLQTRIAGQDVMVHKLIIAASVLAGVGFFYVSRRPDNRDFYIAIVGVVCWFAAKFGAKRAARNVRNVSTSTNDHG